MAQAQAQSLAQVLVTPTPSRCRKAGAVGGAKAAARVRRSIHRPVGNPSVAESASAAAAAVLCSISPSVALGSSHDAALTDSATTLRPRLSVAEPVVAALAASLRFRWVGPGNPVRVVWDDAPALLLRPVGVVPPAARAGTVVPSLWTPMSSALAPELCAR